MRREAKMTKHLLPLKMFPLTVYHPGLRSAQKFFFSKFRIMTILDTLSREATLSFSISVELTLEEIISRF